MNSTLPRLLHHVAVAFFFILLLGPLIVVLPVSLNDEAVLALPTRGISLRWYASLIDDPKIGEAFATSLKMAATVTILSLGVGLPAALALPRLPGKIGGLLLSFFTLPLVLPAVVMGLGLLLVVVQLGLLATFSGLVAAHLIVVTPYVIRLLASANQTRAAGLEDTAATLGAKPLRVFLTITLPMLAPALMAAAALAFLTSFDEAVLSLFLSGANISTLPIVMFDYAKNRGDPAIAALSVLLLAGTFALLIFVERIAGLHRVAK